MVFFSFDGIFRITLPLRLKCSSKIRTCILVMGIDVQCLSLDSTGYFVNKLQICVAMIIFVFGVFFLFSSCVERTLPSGRQI